MNLSTITPTAVKPLVGDHIIFPNGDIRAVVSRSSTTVACGDVIASFKGPKGDPGNKGDPGGQGIPGPSKISFHVVEMKRTASNSGYHVLLSFPSITRFTACQTYADVVAAAGGAGTYVSCSGVATSFPDAVVMQAVLNSSGALFAVQGITDNSFTAIGLGSPDEINGHCRTQEL